MATANFECKSCRVIKELTQALLEYCSDFAHRGANYYHGRFRFMGARSDGLERNLNGLWMVPIKLAKSLVDLRHQNVIPLVNDVGWNRHVRI